MVQSLLQAVDQQCPIGQSGQSIMVRHMPDVLFGLLAFSNVSKSPHGAAVREQLRADFQHPSVWAGTFVAGIMLVKARELGVFGKPPLVLASLSELGPAYLPCEQLVERRVGG